MCKIEREDGGGLYLTLTWHRACDTLIMFSGATDLVSLCSPASCFLTHCSWGVASFLMGKGSLLHLGLGRNGYTDTIFLAEILKRAVDIVPKLWSCLRLTSVQEEALTTRRADLLMMDRDQASVMNFPMHYYTQNIGNWSAGLGGETQACVSVQAFSISVKTPPEQLQGGWGWQQSSWVWWGWNVPVLRSWAALMHGCSSSPCTTQAMTWKPPDVGEPSPGWLLGLSSHTPGSCLWHCLSLLPVMGSMLRLVLVRILLAASVSSASTGSAPKCWDVKLSTWHLLFKVCMNTYAITEAKDTASYASSRKWALVGQGICWNS